MANINNLHAAVASGKQAIAHYKSMSIYQTNAEFKQAIDTLEKQLLDQEAYANTIRESVLFESYLNLPEHKLAEANIALARGDLFKANWILNHLGECTEANKLRENIYYARVGQLFETCSDKEAEFYRSHLSEKALFGSMASQIKKLTMQINDVNYALNTIEEVVAYNQQQAEKKNTALNAKRQDLENKTAALANSENGDDLIKRGKAVNKMNAITDKMGKNLEGSKANQKINNSQEVLAKLKSALEDLNSYLSSEQLKKAITLVDRNTGLFGKAKIDGFVTSKDFKIANMAKQVAAEAGATKEEIAQEEQTVSQEAEAIDQEKEQVAQSEQPQQQQPSSISSMIAADESINNYDFDSLLFESILYEGFFDTIKKGTQALGNRIKQGVSNLANNAKEYFANNTVDDLKQTDVQEIRATFEELANKVATFTNAAKEAQPIFNATGNSKFEIFNRKLGRALLTAGGIVRLAGIACPPLAVVGTAMAGVGAVASGIGNTRKDIVTGHKGKAAIDILGTIAGTAMGASAVGKILGQSGDILAKVSGAGRTLTGVKTTVNGIDKTKNSSTAMGKGMGVLAALGGVAMTLSGLSALGAQFGGSQLSAEDMEHLKQGDAELQSGAQSIVNDEQVQELTAEKVYIEENPNVETEHADLLADTIAKQVGNTNIDIAHAKVGDWIIRDDGTKIELKQFDIDYAKAAIGEIKPETNPFDPENPMVGQITQKGHMITDKDMAILKPNNAPEVVANQVPQVEEKLPEAPAAPINSDALSTELPPEEGVDELANSPEAVEAQADEAIQDTQAAEAASPALSQEIDDFDKNVKWSDSIKAPLTGEFRYDSVSIYGKNLQAVTFNTGVTVAPKYDISTGHVIFMYPRADGTNILTDGKMIGVPSEHQGMLIATALRNAGLKVNVTQNGCQVLNASGQPDKNAEALLRFYLSKMTT
ncbi:MAG: hypothetical protein IKK93_07210 [Campylobacter sp.]|nr:hypothetical protein [Campylobacter sp.]